jgi:hypothetical protein
MNDLHRALAPVSDAARAQMEEETKRTLKRCNGLLMFSCRAETRFQPLLQAIWRPSLHLWLSAVNVHISGYNESGVRSFFRCCGGHIFGGYPCLTDSSSLFCVAT